MATAKQDVQNGSGTLKYVGTRSIRPDGVDKVTGRAKFGSDFSLPGMLVGRVLRSPHAHARIRSIDTSKARALPGVKAIVTRDEMPEVPDQWVPAGEVQVNFGDMARNVMAREKALYEGHAVAAVAATSTSIAKEAINLITVDYEVLPHVIDPKQAMEPDAPVLHETMFTQGVEPTPDKPSNVFKKIELSSGDIEAGFAAADVIVEREFTTAPVHQGYIEPHAVVASASEDGQCQVWCCTQGQFTVRAYCASLLGIDLANIRVTPSEIGGGFGGKTVVYLEPVALRLSQLAGRPVKMTMSREEVFRASGPTSGSAMKIKMGATKDGKITAGQAWLAYQAGAFPGSPIQPGCMCVFAPYDIENADVVGFDVVVNRPKVAAYRAPGAPISEFAAEAVIDELAEKLKIDPAEFRLRNAAKEGTQALYGAKFGPIGCVQTLEAARDSEHYKTPLGPNQGRGIATGFWFNIGGESCAIINISEDGTATVVEGNPDIGGSRASIQLMAAEALQISPDKVQPLVADTSSIGYTFLTGGSRVTFATGMAVVEAAKDIVQQLRERAAKIWEIPVEAVVWEDGFAKPAGSNAGDFDPMSLGDIAAQAGKTGGPISANSSINAQGAGPAFGTHICDVEVDKETGYVKILRYTAVQDAGRAIHPSYVEGQIQGGAAQGIGWALNEEYIYDDKGRLENPGFLDYRMPVASDLPMIDAVVVEVPNPNHPYGVRGVGEVPIVPPMAAVANAIAAATGVRMTDLPMSPPRLLAAMDNGS
jgi:CO/xanthine dehydrogenase Mo-binding subunit